MSENIFLVGSSIIFKKKRIEKKGFNLIILWLWLVHRASELN